MNYKLLHYNMQRDFSNY